MKAIARILLTTACLVSASAQAAPYSVGVGKADSTPGFVDLKTMGYGAPIPTTSGLRTRLFVRAVSLHSDAPRTPQSPETADLHLAIVDTCFVTQKVKIEAVERLRRRYGERFTLANTAISATHTHNAPAGTSSYGHYEISSDGFVPEVFEAQVQAIVEAFSASMESMAPAELTFAVGDLTGASRNRSLAAHMQDPAAERALFPQHVSTEALALFAENQAGSETWAMHLFPVHATTADKSTPLVQSDNKGLAAVLDERERKAQRGAGAVSMFVNGGAGDASPNVLGDVDGNGDWDCAATDDACTLWSAKKHVENLNRLRGPDARRTVDGPLAVVHGYFDMDEVQTAEGQTCPAAFGLSMLAGSAEDGPGTPLAQEGTSCSSPTPLARLKCAQPRFVCHGEKPVMVPTGYRRDVRTPHHLPFQVMRIGQIALVAVPSEVTTVATWRIRQAVLAELRPLGVEVVQLLGYANAYAAYVTTPEEYGLQHYEGAATLFGPHTLDAYIKILKGLAVDLREGDASPQGVPVSAFRDLLVPGKIHPMDVTSAVLRRGERFGELVASPNAQYRKGAKLTFGYLSPNPNRFPLRGGSYVEIQRQEQGAWVVAYTDQDPETVIQWERSPSSKMTVTWEIPADAPAGDYRVLYRYLPTEAASSPSEKAFLVKVGP